jgi:phosphonate transport system substrate-binding protein
VAADLSAATGQRLHFRTASNYASFFDKLMRGDYDLALVQPFFYVAAVDEAGYLPVARVSQPFRSVVVVLASSPIEQVSDLRGKVIASPPLHVPAVHLARQAIRDHGLSPSEDMHFREYTSADSCLHQVMIGTADACVSGPIGAASFQTRHQVQFRTLIETIALPNLAVVAHPRVPAALRQQWGERLQALSQNSEGQTMLQQLNIPAFIHFVDSDYDVVRRFVYALDEPWLPTAN